MRYLLSLLILCSCSRFDSTLSQALYSEHSETPFVIISSVNNGIETPYCQKVAQSLGQAVIDRLKTKKRIRIAAQNSRVKQFSALIDLVEQKETFDQMERSLSIQLSILDLRKSPQKVLLEEVLKLAVPLAKDQEEDPLLSWDEGNWKVSQLGLAHAKLSREIASRIEDYIFLATKDPFP